MVGDGSGLEAGCDVAVVGQWVVARDGGGQRWAVGVVVGSGKVGAADSEGSGRWHWFGFGWVEVAAGS